MENIITISDEFIRLGQALKLSDVAQTGTEAKLMIQAGQVRVNGETEERRGRKLRDGDRVEAKGYSFTVRSRG